jgi:hypothetical protein
MNDSGQHIQVEAYSGYKANERPVAFIFHGRRWEISEILDRWYEGGVNPEQSNRVSSRSNHFSTRRSSCIAVSGERVENPD